MLHKFKYRTILSLGSLGIYSIILTACNNGAPNTNGNTSNKAEVASKALDEVTINNKSSFFLHLQDNSPDQNCPKIINPAQSITYPDNTPPGWQSSCYYNICSTQYSDNGICQEINDYDNQPEPGGFMAWIDLNVKQNTCNLPGYNTGTSTFKCQISNGNFIFNFESVVQKYSAGPNMGKPVTIKAVSPYVTDPGLKFRGVNITGLEGLGTIGDAMWERPDKPEFRYFADNNMNTVRLPINWSYLFADKVQDNEGNEPYYNLITTSSLSKDKIHLNTIYLAGIKDTINKYLSSGVNVIVDMHNDMNFCKTGSTNTVNVGRNNNPLANNVNCNLVSKEDFVNAWDVLAAELEPIAQEYNINQPTQLMLGLQNEPYAKPGQKLTTQELFNMEVAAAKAIQNHGLNNRIIFSGNYRDVLSQWTSYAGYNDIANAQIFTKANFEAAGIDVNKIAIEVHQYFNQQTSSPSDGQCFNYGNYNNFKSVLNLNQMSTWIKDNQIPMMLTEFGGLDSTVCKDDLKFMLDYVKENAIGSSDQLVGGGFIGWMAWGVNRHNYDYFYNYIYFKSFYLNQADYTVYGAQGSSDPGYYSGIAQGAANGLMASVFINYLQP